MTAPPRGVIAHPVAVAPDPVEHVEVALAVARPVRVAPEEERHRGHRLGDDQLPHLVDQLVAVLVVGGDRRAERAALDLARVDRQQRTAGDERGAHVRAHRSWRTATRPRRPPRTPIGSPQAAAAIPSIRRRARLERSRVADGSDALLATAHQKAGARPEAGHPGALGEVPQHPEVGVGRVAVEHHDRRVGEQAADEEVPHHPAGRREPEHPVAGLQVEVEIALLELLEEDPAVALHDRLRQAGRARRVEHPQGVVEGHLLEARLGALAPGLELAPGDRSRERRRIEGGVGVRQQHGARHRRQLGEDAAHRLEAIEVATAVAIAVDREQHLRLDLGEAVDDAPGAELGRRARPDRSEAARGQERDQRLRDVRHVGDDAIAALDAETAQPGGHARDGLRQLAPGERLQRAGLGRVQDGRLGGIVAEQQVLGVVQLARPRTSVRPASATRRARVRTAPRRAPRRSPTRSPRTPRARRPTSATARRSRRMCGRGARRPSA